MQLAEFVTALNRVGWGTQHPCRTSRGMCRPPECGAPTGRCDLAESRRGKGGQEEGGGGAKRRWPRDLETREVGGEVDELGVREAQLARLPAVLHNLQMRGRGDKSHDVAGK